LFTGKHRFLYPPLTKAVTILIRIDRIGDPDRIEFGSILRKISSYPTIIDRLSHSPTGALPRNHHLVLPNLDGP